MSVKELLELSNLLQGDDQERLELEREKNVLTSLIQQHENRLLNESECKMLLAQEFDALLDDFDFEQDNVGMTLTKINDIEELGGNLPLNDVVEKVDRYVSSRYELRDDIFAVRQSLDKMMNNLHTLQELKVDDSVEILEGLQEEIHDATSAQELLHSELSSAQNAVDRMDEVTQQHVHQLQNILYSKNVALEEFKNVSRQLSNLIDQLKAEESKCLVAINDQTLQEQQQKTIENDLKEKYDELLISEIQQADRISSFKDELMSARGRCSEYLSSAEDMNSNLVIFQARLREEKFELNALLKELESQRTFAEQQEKHKTLLHTQTNAYSTNSFKAKLQHLIDETDVLHNQREQALSLISNLEQDLGGPHTTSDLSTIFRSIREALDRKAHIMTDLHSTNEMIVDLVEKENGYAENFAHLHGTIPTRCESSSAVVAAFKNSDQYQSTKRCINNTALDLNLQSLVCHIRQQEQAVASLIFRNRSVQNLKAIQLEQAKLTRMKREKSHLLNALKASRIKIYQESLGSLEASLLQEHRIFHYNVDVAEKSLRAKKNRLHDELEQILSLKKYLNENKAHSLDACCMLQQNITISDVQKGVKDFRTNSKRKSMDHPLSPKKKKTNTVNTNESTIENLFTIEKNGKKPVAKMRSMVSNSSWNPNRLK